MLLPNKDCFLWILGHRKSISTRLHHSWILPERSVNNSNNFCRCMSKVMKQNLLEIWWHMCSVIVNAMAIQNICLLNGISLLNKRSKENLTRVFRKWLCSFVKVEWCIMNIFKMAEYFLDRSYIIIQTINYQNMTNRCNECVRILTRKFF